MKFRNTFFKIAKFPPGIYQVLGGRGADKVKATLLFHFDFGGWGHEPPKILFLEPKTMKSDPLEALYEPILIEK